MKTQAMKTDTKIHPPVEAEVDIDAQIADAEAQKTRLEGAAEDAEAEAERWRVTFEREPTAQAHTEHAVAMQKAKNARTAVATFERDTIGALLERKSAKEREELAVQHRAAIEDGRIARERLSRAVKTFIADLDGAAKDLRDALEAQRTTAQTAPRYETEIARVNEELVMYRGGPYDPHHFNIAFTDQGSAQTLGIHIARPCNVPGQLR